MTVRILTLLAVTVALAAPAGAQDGDDVAALNQRRLREDFQQLLSRMIEVAEMLEATKPQDARTIQQAVRLAQEAFIAQDMDAVIREIERGLFASADQMQGEVIDELREMLNVLRRGVSEPDERRRTLRQWRRHLQEIDELIAAESVLERRSAASDRGADLADDLAAGRAQLQDLIRRQQELLERTDALEAPDAPAAELAALRDRAEALAQEQARLAELAADAPIGRLSAVQRMQQQLAQRLDELAGDLSAALERPDMAEAVASAEASEATAAATEAVELAQGEMADAVERLGQADKPGAGAAQQQSAHDLAEAASRLGEALEAVSGSTPAGELSAEQQDLRDQTQQLSQRLGEMLAEASSMTGAGQDQAEAADGEAGEQGQSGQQGPSGQQGESGEQSQSGQQGPSGEQGPSGQQDDPPRAQRLDAAAEEMTEAAGRLQAQQAEPAAEAERRALEELEAQLAQAEELEQQLRERVESEDLQDQQTQQQSLAERGADLAEQMAEPGPSGSSAPGAASVAGATDAMAESAQSLGEPNPAEANEQQNEALDQLREARERLADAIEEQEQLARSDALARIEAMLRTILGAQREINEETAAVYDLRVGDRYNRPEQLVLTELANAQGRNADEVGSVIEMIRAEGTTAVFPAVLEQVQADMTNIQDLLGDRQAGPTTQQVQTHVAEMLERLIEALQKERGRQSDAGEAPPPEGGQPPQPPLVSFAAELKMLLFLQQQVNQRTVELDTRAAEPDADRELLRQQHQLLSDRQEYIERLTRNLREIANQGREPGDRR